MLLTGWPDVVRYVFWIGLPLWAAFLIMAIPRGVFLAWIASALLDRSGRLPLDRATRTRVIDAGEAVTESESVSESEAVPATESVPPSLPAAARFGITIALVVVSFFLLAQTALLQQSGRRIPLIAPMVDPRDAGRQFEGLFRQVLLVRSRIEVTQRARKLSAEIWLPWTAMSAETMDQGLQSIFQNLTFATGTCDTVLVTYWTGQRSTRFALIKPIPIPLLPDDRAIGGGEDTVCVPVQMPPDLFRTGIGPDVYEPVTQAQVDLNQGFEGRLLRTEGAPPGLIKLPPVYTMNLCIRLTRPATRSMSSVVGTEPAEVGEAPAEPLAVARPAPSPADFR